MFERERQEEKIELKPDSELAEEPDTDPIDDRFLQEQYANRQHERPKIASKYDNPAPRNSIVHAPADKSQSLILSAIIGGISGAIIVLVCFICIQENSQKTKEQPAAKIYYDQYGNRVGPPGSALGPGGPGGVGGTGSPLALSGPGGPSSLETSTGPSGPGDSGSWPNRR